MLLMNLTSPIVKACNLFLGTTSWPTHTKISEWQSTINISSVIKSSCVKLYISVTFRISGLICISAMKRKRHMVSIEQLQLELKLLLLKKKKLMIFCTFRECAGEQVRVTLRFFCELLARIFGFAS